MSHIHFFTTKYGYEQNAGLWKFLRLSAQKCGVEVGGWGERENALPSFYQNRIINMICYLESISDDYVLYCDSRDSLIVYYDPGLAIKNLESYGKPLLVQAERNCFPYPDLAGRYPVISTPYKYLNAGGIFGERKYLLQKLRDLKKYHEAMGTPEEAESDQGLWTIHYLDTQSFALDYKCKVFQSMYLAEDEDCYVEDRRLRNKFFPGSEPMVIHFNGNTPGIRDWYKRIYD